MLLRLLLVASALTTVGLVNATFVAFAQRPAGSDSLNPIASCAPTPVEDEDEEEKPTPRRTSRAVEASV